MAEDNIGWIESIDPTSGRTFYANRYTRTTQWDPPPGWKTTTTTTTPNGRHPAKKNGHTSSSTTDNNVLSDIARARTKMDHHPNGSGGAHRQSSNPKRQQPQQQSSSPHHDHDHDPDALPDGWEEMSDPTTGRKFYIDHATKNTTWERPKKNSTNNNRSNGNSSRGGTTSDTGFGEIMKLNQHGSHSHWDDDPHSGSRVSNNGNNGRLQSSQQQQQDSDYQRDSNSYTMHDQGDSHPGPPALDFVVVSVPDALRMECPGCSSAFTYTKRRHHCRLCGDVFCDACSSTRTILPLDGPEFDTPVRVCDVCMKDVKKGNYFSLRRYLTPLQLFDPNSNKKSSVVQDDGAGSGDTTIEITSSTVAASLSSLSTDIDAMVNEPMSFKEKITIPASVLVSVVGKHLKLRETAEYAIRVLASLVMLGNVVGDDSFALAIYEGDGDGENAIKNSESTNSVPSLLASSDNGIEKGTKEKQPCEIVNDVLAILEWNGSDARSLSALEQAIKVIHYITEPSFIASAISKRAENASSDEDNNGPIDVDAVGEAMHDFLHMDIHRAFRSMLDHATSSASTSLQRWATATLRHLITEDQRRATTCLYSSSSEGPPKYESFMTQLVSTGGIMILCSLLSSEDAETRMHATSTLEAIVIATRQIGMARLHNNNNKTKFSRVGRGTQNDASIVDAIVSNGGCGSALVHLLISAEESVAEMGCSFAVSLISPLLTDPRGSGKALKCIADGEGREDGDDGLASYRHAALALVVGEGSAGINGDVSCLPSLIQISRSGAEQDSSWGGSSPRSMKLQVVAGECLAAIALAIGHILGATTASSNDSSNYDSLYLRATKALQIMEQEQIYDVAYQLVTSPSSRSLDPSRNTPQARLKEAAGLTLLALSSCSDIAASYLTSNKAISQLLTIAAESLDAPSALRGEWASRGLCYLECCAMLLLRAWKNNDNDASCLLDALDANAIGLASRLVTARVHLKHHDKAYSQMRIKIATCYMLSAMFGIATRAENDEKNVNVGAARLYSAMDADCAAALAYGNDTNGSDGRSDLVASTVFLLSATLPYAHRFANEDADEPLPMMDLSEACLLAVGSMCGAVSSFPNDSSDIGISSFNKFGEVQQQGKYSHLRSDAAQMACKALTTTVKDNRATTATAPLLGSVLIGALGESLVLPALRLTLAIAQSAAGHDDVRGELARSGMLVPVGDILQQSLSSGERYTFSMAIAIVRFCGPCCTANYVDSSNTSGSIASLQNSIRTLSCVLMIAESGDDNGMNEHRRNTLLSLKYESLLALEDLSSNEALHSTLIDVFPSLTEFLMHLDAGRRRTDSSSSTDVDTDDIMVCSALKTIRSIISLPSPSPSSVVAIKDMISSLVKILNGSHGENKADNNNRKQEVSLELLHAIALGGKSDMASDNKGNSLLSSGVLDAVASLLGGEGGGMLSGKMTHLGLDIVEFIISNIDSTNPVMMRQFVNDMASHEQFLRALIATMVATKKYAGDKKISVSPLYGTPLLLPDDTAGNDLRPTSAEDKAINVLFDITSLLCSDVSCVGKEHFLHAFMLKDLRGAAAETVSLATCIFIDILMDENNGICVPQNYPANRSFFLDVKLPIVRSQLLEILSLSLDECMASSNNSSRKHAETLICEFKIPQLCLLFCQSKKLFQAGFELYENVVLPLPTNVIGDLLLADKSSLVALFDLVTTGRNNSVQDVEHSKQVFALTLGNLAKAGFLSTAVERFGVRNNAIAALSAAMQGSHDETIDENEDSLPRICVESLAAILRNNQQEDELEITALEARAMATAIGKILSSTVLNRFFTQASLETTFDNSMDHSSDRSAISQSPEARLLCSMASFPETLEMLQKVGGLEAIGLIAHEGELAAIRAIQKACELIPTSVVDVDAHLSIMDALIQVECKLVSTDPSDICKLREVVTKCIQIITTLSQNTETKSAILSAEQSFGCLTASASIISASSKLLNQKSNPVEKGITSVDKCHIRKTEKAIDSVGKDTASLGSSNEDLQLGDLVLVDSTSSINQSSPLKSNQSNDVEGIVAHLGAVKFAPGDDWIGIRLTGSSVGLGRNDGSVKGVRYFDCGANLTNTLKGNNDKNGVFVKRNNVKTQECEVEFEAEKETKIQVEMATEDYDMPQVESQQEQIWDCLLSNDDFTLERASFSLLQSFSSSKPHRDLLMKTETVINDMMSVIQLHSPALTDFQCNALDLLVSLTLHLHEPDVKLTKLFCSVVESRTKVLQTSRDKRLLYSTKQLLVLAISGLENTFCAFMDADEKSRSLKVASNLFVFLADSLFKGPKSRRLAASMKDGVLFYHLSSFFVLSLGSESLRTSILSIRFVSSLIRFIMMTAGLASFDCQIPITESEGGEHWKAALSHCLYCLSISMAQSSQDHLGISYAPLIGDTEASPKSFQLCLKHIADKKLGGASSISAKQILAKLERLPVS